MPSMRRGESLIGDGGTIGEGQMGEALWDTRGGDCGGQWIGIRVYLLCIHHESNGTSVSSEQLHNFEELPHRSTAPPTARW